MLIFVGLSAGVVVSALDLLPTLKTVVQIPSKAGSPGHQAVIGIVFVLEFNLGGYHFGVLSTVYAMQNECELAYQAIMNSAWYLPAP